MAWRAFVVAALAACAPSLPPREEMRVPDAWAGRAAETPVGSWLGRFGDPALDALAREAVKHNPDLRISAARVAAATAQVRAAGARLYPSLTAAGRYGVGLGGDGSGLSGALVAASWELDVWGRVAAGRAAATASETAALADRAFARQSLVASVAKAWFVAAEAQLQQRLFDSLWRDAVELVRLVEVRRGVGNATDRDVALARAEAAGYKDKLLQTQEAVAEARRALELLVGRYPDASLSVGGELRAVVETIPAGLPAQLLERRPDVIAARERLNAAYFLVAEAEAARFPSLSLTAALGAVTSDLFQLKTDSPWLVSGGASLLAPLFLGGELAAQVDLRTAEQDEALATYAKVVLGAFGEVEAALTAEQTLRERQPVVEETVEEHAKAYTAIAVEYEVGKVDLLSLLDQRLNVTTARSALLRLKSERLIQRVVLHLALGGDFGVVQQ
jgi:outer membrane protein, multidrug efflux system